MSDQPNDLRITFDGEPVSGSFNPFGLTIGQRVTFSHEFQNVLQGATGTLVEIWPDLIWPVFFVRLDTGGIVRVDAGAVLKGDEG